MVVLFPQILQTSLKNSNTKSYFRKPPYLLSPSDLRFRLSQAPWPHNWNPPVPRRRSRRRLRALGNIWKYGGFLNSWNRGNPQISSAWRRCSIINHPFWGTPTLGNLHIVGIESIEWARCFGCGRNLELWFPTWRFPEIGVPSKSSTLMVVSTINHPFWGTPILGSI